MTEPRDVLAEALLLANAAAIPDTPEWRERLRSKADEVLAAMPDHLLVRKDEWANAIAAVEYAARSLPASGSSPPSRLTSMSEREPRTAAMVSALAYALARAPLPTDTMTSRDYAETLAPLVLGSGYLAIEAEAAAPQPSALRAALDVDKLAEAWANVMDGRRIGTGLHAARIGRETTTSDDWRAIATEYVALTESTEPAGETDHAEGWPASCPTCRRAFGGPATDTGAEP